MYSGEYLVNFSKYVRGNFSSFPAKDPCVCRLFPTDSGHDSASFCSLRVQSRTKATVKLSGIGLNSPNTTVIKNSDRKMLCKHPNIGIPVITQLNQRLHLRKQPALRASLVLLCFEKNIVSAVL
nr:uncharacterized protein LOC114827689 [Malus domestica]